MIAKADLHQMAFATFGLYILAQSTPFFIIFCVLLIVNGHGFSKVLRSDEAFVYWQAIQMIFGLSLLFGAKGLARRLNKDSN